MITRALPLRRAAAYLLPLLFAWASRADTYPVGGGVQDFSTYTTSAGLVTFADGSAVYPTVNAGYNASAVIVENGALVLTGLTLENTASRYWLPVIDGTREVTSFTLTFDLKMAALDPSGTAYGEGFSVNFGAIPAGSGTGETGFPMANGLTIGWDTRDNGGEDRSIRVYANGSVAGEATAEFLGATWSVSDSDTPVSSDFRQVVIHWDAEGLDMSWGGIPVFTNVETAGFVPSSGDRFAFSARTSTTMQITAIDNVSVTTTAEAGDLTGGPVISEFLASNKDSLEDEDFDHPDWIEIYNGQTTSINLDGWYLTNNSATPQMWRFPSMTIGARGYAYVFASGKNRTASLHKHTSFTLPKEGGHLALVRPDGSTAHSLNYPAQHEDISYGTKGVGLEPGYFDTMTPGVKNSVRLYNGVITEAPVILNAGGTPAVSGMITAGTTLSIAPPSTPAGYVRYLTTGAMPVETPTASTLYTAPINVTTRSVALRARVFAPGMVPGPVSTVSLVLLGADLVNYRSKGAPFASNLPVMVMDSFGYAVDGITDPNNSARGTFRYTWTQVFDPAKGVVPGTARMNDAPSFQGPSGTHVRGQSSAGFPQLPYALELWDEKNQDLDFPLLGMPADSDWVLYNPHNEETFLRNMLAYDTIRKWRAEGAGMRTRLVEVFFNQQANSVTYADYRGIYVLVEKIKRGSSRVNVEKLNNEVTDPAMITGGYVFKKDKPPQVYTVSTTSTGGWGGQTYEVMEPDIPNTAQTTWLRTHLQAFETSLMSASWQDPVNGYRKYADTSAFADNQLWVEMFKQIDGYRISTYFSKTRAGKIRSLPAWDYNLSAGNANYLGGENTAGWYYSHIGGGDLPFWPRLIQDPGYVLEMWDRFWQIRRGVLSDAAVTAAIDGWSADITAGDPRPVMNNSRTANPPATNDFDTPASRHFAKWPTLAVYNWPNSNNFAQRNTYQSEIAFLKGWMRERLNWMELKSMDQISAAAGKLRPPNLHDAVTRAERYSGSVPGGLKLDLADPNAAASTIYYTVNGPDPRTATGTVDPAALTQTGGAATRTVLIPFGTSWKYLGSTASTAPAADGAGKIWKEPGFVDTAWGSGATPIGYGDTGMATALSGAGVVPSGNANQVSYFRGSFNVADPSSVYELRADLTVDDGAVIYVNGQEAARFNMPFAPAVIAVNSRANGAMDVGLGDWEPENSQVPLRLPASLLVAGQNTIAVEVHQFLYGSGNTGIGQATDMRFNLQLSTTSISAVPTPIMLGSSGVQEVRARVRVGSAWSPLTLGSFLVDTAPGSAQNLVVSEFLYDPAEPSPAEVAVGANSANDFEFIEILNISSGNVDLTGVTIENAINFNFTNAPEALRLLPPGGRVVVAENAAAFNARWPGRTAVLAGVFASGNLSNDGELFTLRARDGNIIRQFTYDNEEPWPSIAGIGPQAGEPDYSVVLNNPFSGPDHANPLNWRASAASRGNPGGVDSAPGPAAPSGDANQNGIPDLLDYVFPNGPIPLLSMEEVDAEAGVGLYPVLEITRSLNADGYTLEPEFSTDLSTWTPGGAAWMSNDWKGDGTVVQKWRFTDPAPAPGTAKRFVRLKVTTVP